MHHFVSSATQGWLVLHATHPCSTHPSPRLLCSPLSSTKTLTFKKTIAFLNPSKEAWWWQDLLQSRKNFISALLWFSKYPKRGLHTWERSSDHLVLTVTLLDCKHKGHSPVSSQEKVGPCWYFPLNTPSHDSLVAKPVHVESEEVNWQSLLFSPV